ncbi:hypothetical protein FB566_1234 [Stackebrandtia endophytica]|uniref:BioF2-like acetyltransferase domain-containing protein n=1 Tax=Stackebrandtia endophytica TaxID=1496996 RepID=A0A543AT13_9ACTN|nr:hypothetical protein [Stackebrandtia endophytica]TQL75722.1 hypothetical protein FB566_1234 [Stackebrandtia endophytica]
MKVELFDPRVDPLPPEWEKLRGSANLSAAWSAEALTALSWGSARTVYLGVAFQDDEPVGLFTGEFGPYAPRKPRYSTPGKPATGFYLCRMLAGFSQGMAFHDELGWSDRRAACRALEKALRLRLGLRCFGIIYGNVTDETVGLVDGWLRLRRPVSPNIVLRNEWSTMDEYLEGLPRTRRRTFSRIYRDVNESDEVTLLSPVDRIDPEQASRLDVLTRTKYLEPGENLFPLPHAYFEQLNNTAGVRYFAHQSSETGMLESFDLTFDQDGVLTTTVTGSRESRLSQRLHLYHDLYLREISYLIEHRLHTVEFGKGLFDLKSRFGCVRVPQYAVAAAF